MPATDLQVVPPQSTQLTKQETFAPRNLSEAIEFAKLIADSGMVPKDYIGKPGAIVVAMQMGLEIGLQPMQAMQSIAVINGRPSVWGDGALAIVKSHPEFVSIHEDDLETITKNSRAVCILKRRGQPDVKVTFTQADAATAGLWKKAGPWTTSPARMLQMRARSFAMRDQFPDALKGIVTAEEAQDYPAPTIEGTTTATVDTASTEKKPEPEKTIGRGKATDWYKLYKSHGFTPEEAKAFLKEKFGIELPKTSVNIPEARYAEAETWAKGSSPTRNEIIKAFKILGFTEDEQVKFFDHRNCDYQKTLVDLKAEIAKRDAQEQ